MPRLYDPLLVMVYADEAVQALLKGDLVNVIVNQNNYRGTKVFILYVTVTTLVVSKYRLHSHNSYGFSLACRGKARNAIHLGSFQLARILILVHHMTEPIASDHEI